MPGLPLEQGAQNAGRTRAVPQQRSLSPVLGGWEQRQGTGAAWWAPVFPTGAGWPAPGGAGPLVGLPGGETQGRQPRHLSAEAAGAGCAPAERALRDEMLQVWRERGASLAH